MISQSVSIFFLLFLSSKCNHDKRRDIILKQMQFDVSTKQKLLQKILKNDEFCTNKKHMSLRKIRKQKKMDSLNLFLLPHLLQKCSRRHFVIPFFLTSICRSYMYIEKKKSSSRKRKTHVYTLFLFIFYFSLVLLL